MSIDSINNNVGVINSTHSSSLERIASGLAINKASDNSSSLSIADNIDSQRSVMHQALENINSGIAMSNIAQDGLSQQKDILNEIKVLTLQASTATTSDEGREAIGTQISKFLDQFDQVAQNATYNSERLLTGDQKDLSVITDEDSSISMETKETKTISDKIRNFLGNFATDLNAINNLRDATNEGINEVQSFASEFASSANQMESSGRSAISAQTSLAEANSSILDADYSKEITDFSKTNLMAQIGMLAASQANAVQQRSVALLS